jgi:hypothetical protein
LLNSTTPSSVPTNSSPAFAMKSFLARQNRVTPPA